MAWSVFNHWPDIAELRTSEKITASNLSTETEIRVELYIDTHEIDIEGYCIEVGFSKLTLQFECHGTQIALGERYGDVAPVTTSNELIRESLQSLQSGYGLGLGVNASTTGAASVTGSIGANRASKGSDTTKSKSVSKSKEGQVVAKSNGRWEIRSLDNTAPCSAKFLTEDIVLCSVEPLAGSNINGLEIHLYAHKKDLALSTTKTAERPFFLAGASLNKEKVFKILAANCLLAKREGLDEKNYIQLSKVSNIDQDA